MYYKSRDLMAMLRQLRQRDPQALIVIFGDHLPFLGPNHAVYTEAGKLAKARDQFSNGMFRYLVETPLIVIDGERGPVPLGAVPLYQMPQRMLKLLNMDGSVLSRLTGKVPHNARPLPGMSFTMDEQRVDVCKPGETQTDACQATTRWLEAVDTIKRDVFAGHQHALR